MKGRWKHLPFFINTIYYIQIKVYMYRRFQSLNEANAYRSFYSNEDIIEKLGEVDVYDSSTKSFVKMKATDIMKVASDALYKMQRDYNYLYQYLTRCKLMYIPTFPSKITNTMAVDNYNNLWMNLSFIYDQCKMDTNRVFGILFHELFHIFFNHLLRFRKEFPDEMFAAAGPGVYKKANTKANLCQDYEVNASMVEDEIVSPDFWTNMHGLYKKEYTGMTWEEILHKYGDKEYDEWLAANGESLDDVEKKILEAIEEASRTLMDPEADDDDKRAARKRLKKKLDDILGRETAGEDTLQETLEQLGETKLADHGDIAQDLDKLVDDLNRDPSRMSTEELNQAMRDMDKLADDILENAEDIASDFGKSAEDVAADAQKARETVKEALKKINEGGLSKEEQKALMDKAKDAMEDIISDDVEKEKLKEKRAERDAKREEAIKEKLKKTHPLRKMLIILKNLKDLRQIDLISDGTAEILQKCIDAVDVLTGIKLSDMKKRDMKDVSDAFGELKTSLLPDLVALIENETILQKTEDDMKHLLDTIFEHVYNAFRRIFDTTIDDEAKASLLKMAAQKLRTIGKVLKTQKKWRVGEDFKRAYREEMKRLMDLRKSGGDEALMKELLDLGVINPLSLDEHGEEVYKAVTGKSSKFDDLFDTLSKLSGEDKAEISDDEAIEGIVGALRDEGVDDDDLEKVMDALSKIAKEAEGDDITTYSEINDDVEPYEGKMYYTLFKTDDDEILLQLSDMPDGCRDSGYEKFGVKFESDFPEYWVDESMESEFVVFSKNSEVDVDFDTLKKKLEDHPDYEEGEW